MRRTPTARAPMTRRRRRVAWTLGLAAVLSAGVLGVVGLTAGPPTGNQATDAQPVASGPSFVLRAKAVYPVTAGHPGPIEGGMVLVRDGRIEAVGLELDVPPDLPLIDLRDEIVCPGFVLAGSSLAGRHAGPDTVSGAYSAVDAFDTYAEYVEALSRGTTTVHLDPGDHRLISGLGAVVKLAGPPERRVLVPGSDLTINLGVFDPPPLVERPFYASSDVPIEPARGQRPDSRLGQFLELDQRIATAEHWLADPSSYQPERFDLHADSFVEAWAAELPLRIQADRAADIEAALSFIARHDLARRGVYLAGLAEADRLAEELTAAGIPLVMRIGKSYRNPGRQIGPDPDALEPRLTTAGELTAGARSCRVMLALAGAAGDRNEDPRMAAIMAARGGMSPEIALAAITRVPAEILRVDSRVGSLAIGKDADLLVLTGQPLDINSHVRRVYVGGQVVFDAPVATVRQEKETEPRRPLVIRAGSIWVGDGTVLRDAALLIEDGKIQAVGQRVPHPPLARLIDAGPDAFLTPGFIDAHGHLGLDGDQTVAAPDLSPHRAIAAAGREFARVARAGVTSVLLAPYRADAKGGRMAAIKTHGLGREELVARELCGLRFSLRGDDPLLGIEPLKKAIEAGKKYDETWKKYEDELAQWKAGKLKDGAKDATEAVVEEGQADPITGTWEYTLSGDPLPETVTGTITAKLTGTRIEARMTDPTSGEEVELTGTLDGNEVTLEVDVETPMGKPTIRATIDREDHMVGAVSVGDFSIAFEATRTDKSAVEFKVQRKRKRTKDGRPAPPKVDERLEPYRALLAGKIPAVVEVETAGQIAAVVKLFVDELKLPLVLLGADNAADVADVLVARKDKLGVVVQPDVQRARGHRPYEQVVDLSRRGVPVALQSNAEDAARDLPLMGLFAVRRGLGGDAALRALTIDAARMYQLDDRLGSLAVGRDGDVLIFDGHPFDADSRLERVIVSGREVPDGS